jgi:hypothetical protein
MAHMQYSASQHLHSYHRNTTSLKNSAWSYGICTDFIRKKNSNGRTGICSVALVKVSSLW